MDAEDGRRWQFSWPGSVVSGALLVLLVLLLIFGCWFCWFCLVVCSTKATGRKTADAASQKLMDGSLEMSNLFIYFYLFIYLFILSFSFLFFLFLFLFLFLSTYSPLFPQGLGSQRLIWAVYFMRTGQDEQHTRDRTTEPARTGCCNRTSPSAPVWGKKN